MCHNLLPQVEEVLEEFPHIYTRSINAETVSEIAGYLSVFTVPALILYADGKEVLREARFVPIDYFREQIEKVYRTYLP